MPHQGCSATVALTAELSGQLTRSAPDLARKGGLMKAIVQDRYGSPDVLELRDVDKPVAADTEVLVRVHAAAVNARDWHVMRGDPYVARLMLPSEFGFGGPKVKIRGTDFAGRVDAVGRGVQRFRPGDEVFGEVNGAFAEYVCAPDDVVEHKPANLTFVQAAAVPLAGNTALMCLRDAGRVQPGQQVLVNGASGGVGTFAVQIAKSFGAEVTGVCSTGNVDMVRSIGADHVIDYTHEDFTRNGRRYDVIFDLVGNRSLTECRRVLTPAGTLILSGGGVSGGGSLVGPMGLILRAQVVSRFVRHRLVQLTATPSRENLATLRELIESGKVAPVIDRTYPLSEAPEAIRYLEVEHARAKVVITV
jgi:NADPH:quinone reductase-like Zn-dependent oxidoreductase